MGCRHMMWKRQKVNKKKAKIKEITIEIKLYLIKIHIIELAQIWSYITLNLSMGLFVIEYDIWVSKLDCYPMWVICIEQKP